MIEKPLVSVIIPTFNRSHYLKIAVESVLDQTYKNIEVIIVDDGSTDSTEKLISKYFNNKVKYIKNNKNKGLSESRNIGIVFSKGDFISFLDDDDVLLPEKLSKQIDLFQQNDKVDIVYCGSIYKYQNISIEKPALLKGKIYPQALEACPNAIHTLLIKKKCLDQIGLFDRKFIAYEDLDLWIRLSKKFTFDFVPENLVIYYIHGNQMSVQLERKIRGREMILQKYHSELKDNVKFFYWHLRKLASRYALLDEYAMSRKLIIKSISIKPLNIGSYIHLILSLICRPLHKKIIKKYAFTVIGDITLV